MSVPQVEKPFVSNDWPEIRTSRLILRHVLDSDVNDLFAIRSCMDVMKYSLAGKPDADISETTKKLQEWKISNGPSLVVMEAKDPASRACGTLGLRVVGSCVEFGYMLHRDVWGKGYATEAVRACIDAWWNGHRGMEVSEDITGTLWAVTKKGNEASYGVLRKCGFETVEELEDEHGHWVRWKLDRPNSKPAPTLSK